MSIPLRIAVSALALLLPALPARAAETTERWVSETRARIDRLVAEDRLREAVEEWGALIHLLPGEMEPIEQAALLAVRCGELEGERFRPGARFFVLAERFARRAPKKEQGVSPTLLYVIARLNFAAAAHHEAYLLFNESRRLGCDEADIDHYAYRAAANRAAARIESGVPGAEDEVIETIRAEMDRSQDDPDLPDIEKLYAHVSLASAHNVRQEEPVALELLGTAIERYGKNVPGTALGFAYRLLGDIHRNRGAMDVAIGHYRTLLDIVNPTDALYGDGLIRLADVLLRAQPPQLEEAEKVCRDYLALRPGDATGLLTLGRIVDEAGRPEEALRHYRAARESAPDAISVLDRLRSSLYLMDTPEARAELADVEHAIDYIRRAARPRRPKRDDPDDDE